MALIWNVKTGQQEEIPDDQVQQALASGAYAYRKLDRIDVVGPDGKSGSVSGEDVFTALSSGFRLETPEETQQRLERKEYGESTLREVQAGAAGALRGLTFGLSDALLTKTGAVDPEHLRALKEQNPTASTAGELGAVAAGIIGTGGLGALGKGAAAAGGAVRGVSAAGRATEQLVARALQKGGAGAARQIVSRIAPKMAGSALEGAFYGAGQAVSEAALGDTDLTAEHLLAGAGMGALLGGVAAGAVGAGGVGLDYGVRGAGKALKSTAQSIGKLFQNATGATPHPRLGEIWAKASAAVSGAESSTIASFLRPGKAGKAARAAAVMPDEAVDDIAARLVRDADTLESIYAKAIDFGRGKAKEEAFKGLVQNVDPTQVATSSGNTVMGVKLKLQEMLETVEDFGFRRQVKLAQQAVTRAEKWLGRDGVSAGERFIAVDTLKRDLGRLRVQMRKSITSADQATKQVFDDIYEGVRLHLEDASVYGTKAAETQRVINAAWRDILAPRNYSNNFFVRFGQEEFDDLYRANPEKFRQFVNGLGTTRTQLDDEWIAGQVQGKRRLLDLMEEYYDIPPDAAAELQRAREAATRFGETLALSRDGLTLRNQLRELDRIGGAVSGLGVVGAGAIGLGLGSLPGAAAGATIAALSAPGKTIRQLAALERIQGAVRSRIDDSISQWAARASEAARSVSAASARASRVARRGIAPAVVLSVDPAEQRRERRDRLKSHEAQVAKLDRFAADPDYASRTMMAGVSKFANVAPSVALAAQATGMRAVEFLRSKAPRPAAPVGILPQQWRPSDAQIAKFERYSRAVEKPMTVLSDLTSGRLTLEAVEAVRAVYPRLYDELVGSVLGRVGELQQTMPYQERRQLSILLGIPVDPTTAPPFVAAMQQQYAQLAAAQAQGQGSPAGGGKTARKTSFTLADKAQTTAQRLTAK